MQTKKAPQVSELEDLANELYQLKQDYDNAATALDMAKVVARNIADIGPNGAMLEVVTDDAWLTVKRSGRFSAPSDAELEAIGPELTGRLFRRTKKVKPNARANWTAFLKRLDAAGIDYKGFFEAEETTIAVKNFGEEYEYAAADLEAEGRGGRLQALTDMVERITQPATVTIRPADLKKEKGGE